MASTVQEHLENRELIGLERQGPSRVRVEPWPRWVRAFVNGSPVADSKRALLVMEDRRLPVYYFPPEDVRMDLLVPSGRTEDSSLKGRAEYLTLTVGEITQVDAAWRYPGPPEEIAPIAGRVAFHWNAVDAWFEEEDEVFVHPRDPYHRVDVLQSSRHARVELDGLTVAETHRPRLLFETGLPTRYYIPKLDVRMDVLTPTDTRTQCPYKGEAVYWSAEVNGRTHPDIVWSYPSPIPECPKIENHLAFFNEHADIYVDGELQERPETPWSKR